MKKTWAVSGIAFVIIVMTGWAHWERARANESIPEESLQDCPVNTTDSLVPYSTAPLLDNRFERMEQMIEDMHAVICAPDIGVSSYHIYEPRMTVVVSDPNDELITYGPEPGPWVLLTSCEWCGMLFYDTDVDARWEHGRNCKL